MEKFLRMHTALETPPIIISLGKDYTHWTSRHVHVANTVANQLIHMFNFLHDRYQLYIQIGSAVYYIALWGVVMLHCLRIYYFFYKFEFMKFLISTNFSNS